MKNFSSVVLMSLTLSGLAFSIEKAEAFNFQYKDVNGFIDTTVSTGVSLRVQDRRHALIGKANGGTANTVDGDDGNRNYSKGSLTAATQLMTNDIGASYKNYSAFVRTTYFYDPVNLYKKELTPYERRNAGQGFQLLDAYVEGKFEPADKKLNIRAGKQVLNWGESLFIPGALTNINAVDVSKLHQPGSEIRNALLPSPMISHSLQLSENFSFSNYYLFKYDRTKLDICGTYFATSDFAGCENGNGVSTIGYGTKVSGTLGYTAYQTDDQRPSNQGQYGAALKYLATQWHDTEFGLYFENYHNHVPVANAISNLPALGYYPFIQLKYLENIQVFGFTTSVDLGGIAVQGEYTYRPRYPLQIDGAEYYTAAAYTNGLQVAQATAPYQTIRGYKQLPVNQMQASFIKSFGQDNPFKANEWMVMGEAAMIYISHFPNKSDLRFDGPNTDLPGYTDPTAPGKQTKGFADRLSWGYVLSTSVTYQQFVKNVDLKPRIAFSHDVEGTSPSPLSQFVNGRMGKTFGITATYLSSWSLDASYTNYSGAGNRNLLNDRDFVSITLKHWF